MNNYTRWWLLRICCSNPRKNARR